MKTSILSALALVFFSGQAFAEKTLLACNAPGNDTHVKQICAQARADSCIEAVTTAVEGYATLLDKKLVNLVVKETQKDSTYSAVFNVEKDTEGLDNTQTVYVSIVNGKCTLDKIDGDEY